MGRPKKGMSVAELSEQLEAARGMIDQLTQHNALLASQTGMQASAPRYSGQLVVGLRNVSNYTVSLTDNTTGKAVVHVLHPEHRGRVDPQTRAVVSYAFWQQLRVGNWVGKGVIIRDDSLLGPAENVGPEDRPMDMHPEAERNVVLEPRSWILSKTEAELRAAISAMTSEPTLRRLQLAVDQEIWDIGAGKYEGNEDRPRLAIRDLPGVFRIVDELSADRLDELNPTAKARVDEMTLRPRNTRH